MRYSKNYAALFSEEMRLKNKHAKWETFSNVVEGSLLLILFLLIPISMYVFLGDRTWHDILTLAWTIVGWGVLLLCFCEYKEALYKKKIAIIRKLINL